jgi:hypothetical protein
MRWLLTDPFNQHRFWKLEDEQFIAELKYNVQAQSFRLASGDKRLFFIEKAGFLQNKYFLKTEYSIVTGEVSPAKDWRSGLIVIESKKFNYFLKNDLLTMSSKKESLSMSIEINNAINITQSELFALLFSSLKIVANVYKATRSLA